MKVYGSNLPFGLPARTYIIDGSVQQPEAWFVEALQKAKFRISSKPGQAPIELKYGTLGKQWLAEFPLTLFLPEKFQRWELSI